jgi:hypothetical protein
MITKIIPQIQKVYIDTNSEGTITCPSCEKSKRANFAKQRDLRDIFRVKCGCGCAFGIIIDQRKYYRKKLKTNGNYTVSETHESGSIIVEDLSFTGIGFQTRRPHKLLPGDMIEVRFVLDDERKSEVCKQAVVRRIREQFVGAEFVNDKAYDKALGFYLLPA